MQHINVDGNCSQPPGGGGSWGGIYTSSNFRFPGSACEKNWTQSDLKFCENEGSKRFKINEIGVNWIQN